MTACPLKLDAGACSERGRRSSHEDAVGQSLGPDGTAVYVVADGLGGHSGGDVAAQRAVQAVLDFCPGPGDLVRVARGAVDLAHELVLDEQRRTGLGCRTTLALLLVRGERAVVAHVGDSRVYRFRGGVLEHLTRFHGYARHLGAPLAFEAEPYVCEVDAQPGDVFALTTCGVHVALRNEGIRAVLHLMGPVLGPRWAAEELVVRALGQSSTDNCTALVVRVPVAGGAA